MANRNQQSSQRSDAAGSTSREHVFYRELDDEINTRIGATVGFTALTRPTPYSMQEDVVAGYRRRYDVIKRFQQQTLDLFKASLRGDADPEIAAMVTGELPAQLGLSYHRQLTDLQHRTPIFFRTDEVAHGKLSEVQCSGSAWGLVEELRALYGRHPEAYGAPVHFPDSLASLFAKSLREYLNDEPIVHHLVDNASRPHGVRYFIQRVRDEGIKYFSYDFDIGPDDVNFVRSHDFVSVMHHNFYANRLDRCNRGEVYFDLPPSCLFDGKVIFTWPFWEKTRDAYDDEIREVFPFTSLIRADGLWIADGEHVTLDEFCQISNAKRNYYIKYGGIDVAINWGSRSVYLASTYSRLKCQKLLNDVVADAEKNRYWIIQQGVRREEETTALTRAGDELTMAAYSKFSGFYGPSGLMAILVFQRHSHKVHGHADSILSLVY